MNHSTIDILTHQRLFFVTAILIEVLTECMLSATAHILDRTMSTDYWLNSWDTIQNIIEAITSVYICVYGLYLCRKGYLKKYASYAFIAGCLCAIIMPIIYEVPDTICGSIISLGVMCIYFTSIIIPIKSSAMTGRMKWCLGLGYIVEYVIMGIILAIMEELNIQTNIPEGLELPVIITICVFNVIALVWILTFYNRKIKEAALIESQTEPNRA